MNPQIEVNNTLTLQAILAISAGESVSEVLQMLVNYACEVTGSAQSVFSTLDVHGHIIRLNHHGYSGDALQRLEGLMNYPSFARDLSSQTGFYTNAAAEDSRFSQLLAEFPACKRLLMVPVFIEETVYGWLYVANKSEAYTDLDLQVCEALSQTASVAIINAERYAHSQEREAWMAASQEMTTFLLNGSDEEEALTYITTRIRQVAQADTALLILPSVGDTWACEIADGWHGNDFIGAPFPPNGRARTALKEGQGIIVDSLTHATTLRIKQLAIFGPALYAPLISGDNPIGVVILLRRPGRPEFPPSVLPLAESVATQAALALEIADAKHAQDMANLLNERNRIAQDLHDLAIQQLFATGMQLSHLREELSDGTNLADNHLAVIDEALNSVDDSVKQIRRIVHSLKEPDDQVDLVERLRREASMARNTLGFAPSLVIMLDGAPITSTAPDQAFLLASQIERRINHDLADDVVAVVREALSNIARHAGASSAQVQVDVGGIEGKNLICVTVSDDGSGLNPTNSRRSGVANLANRARRHGGSSRLANGLEAGAVLHWEAPLT